MGSKDKPLLKQMNPRFIGIVREEHKVITESELESSFLESPAKEAQPRLDSMFSDSGGSKYAAWPSKEPGGSAVQAEEEKKAMGNTGGSNGLSESPKEQKEEESKGEVNPLPIEEEKKEVTGSLITPSCYFEDFGERMQQDKPKKKVFCEEESKSEKVSPS